MASSATVSSISNTNESNTEERRRDSNDGKETGPNFTSSSANEQSCRDKPPQNNNDEASEQQLQISKPEGWLILERENPEYGRNILSSHYRCLDCRNTHIAKATKKLKPHCLCSLKNKQDENENSVNALGMGKCCNWKCPAGGQLSHCPTCRLASADQWFIIVQNIHQSSIYIFAPAAKILIIIGARGTVKTIGVNGNILNAIRIQIQKANALNDGRVSFLQLL